MVSEKKMIQIIQSGIEKSSYPKRILIVGAGMSGLVAASLLNHAGHNVQIIEASTRVGGRVFTKRAPFTEGLYLDVGAMRIPNTHRLVMEYVKKFNLPLQPFINSSPHDILYLNGIKTTYGQYLRNPDILNYPVSPSEKGKNVNQLITKMVEPIFRFVSQNPKKHWPIVIEYFEKFSVDDYLRSNPYGLFLSNAAIELIKIMHMIEGFPEFSLVEVLREMSLLFNDDVHFYEIKGGNDLLPNAFLSELYPNIHFNRQVVKIHQTQHDVTISCIHPQTKSLYHYTGDIAIITIPFSTLQFVQMEPYDSVSHEKRKAIRELHYVTSAKIGLQFSQRFWEKEGMYGGRVITDLPTRFSYFPSHDFDSEGHGVMLASYTWEDDALPWESLTEDEQIRKALDTLSIIYDQSISDHFVIGISHNWGKYPYSSGCFTLYKPWQETELSPHIASPEGRMYFAGEHTDVPHGWIQTAIKSGIRVALEVNHLP
ncbi:Flavin-dependent L-tryptophan oxidase RebO [Anoxybacillus sp. P3H1B]|uniref:flavin monoamine oxidase family protein n=1 Tax=Anoxybacillaceae TaxID=3120669 RepID=UPI0007945A56|nr:MULTISPECIES: flavin monoamine oxidase family protein [Anoxybacillus]KXG09441.1 Flavin-dependent L-tryptophan oxidase RebO [Anoxybacillus sp. P3H1B]